MRTRPLCVLWLAALVTSCTGVVGDPAGDNPRGDGVPPPSTVEGEGAAPVWVTGARRLTVAEYRRSVEDLLGFTPAPASLERLPADFGAPFDNDYAGQLASSTLIEGVESLAAELAGTVMADPALRDAVVGCTPSGPDDATCMRTFIATFGRRALRRPLTGEEIGRFLVLGDYATVDNAHQDPDFYLGAVLVLEAFLQHPEFLYRIETGDPVAGEPGLFRIRGFEIATRLSFLFWGTTPDEALLSAAEAGELDDLAGVAAHAERLFADPRAQAQLQRFHAEWLGYAALPHEPQLAAAFQDETQRLIQRIVFEERRPWTDLLTADGTFLDDSLAAHYGLPAPGSSTPVWVGYGDSRRAGLFSHAAFLSNGRKWNDTSPVARGIFIRERVLCQEVPPPPPEVNVDDPPPVADDSPCKEAQYAAHRAQGSGCANCHQHIDPIGFGLENYDGAGRYRAHDVDLPQCAISGDGEITPLGTFNGPAGLGAMLAGSAEMDHCVVTQLYRFASGHIEADVEREGIQTLVQDFAQTGRRFDELVIALVASEGFLYRREEP